MFDIDEQSFIDFSNLSINNNTQNKNTLIINNYNFDKTTTETYKVMRELHLDPITHEKVPDNLDFKFEYMWDPITGDRLEKDPNGPFHFNVLTLAENFYHNRLRMLWIDGETINGIKYEGYYGDALCSGEDIYVPSRGISKHMHLFRLPIIDCYLQSGFDYSVITMGPKLTYEEIDEIQNIIDKYYKVNTNISKKNKTKTNIINISHMRNLYMKAISKTSTEKEARCAVDELKKIKI